MMTNPVERSRPYSESFALYVKAGWQGVIPVTRKHPPQTGYTGVDGLYPSFADMQTWADNDEGDRNIALRMTADVLGVDVDAYSGKHGGATLLDCEARWGPLPATWRSTSRDDGISGIRFYRIPTGLAWPGQLPGGCVELVRWDHRYAVVWPSLHPETNRIYRWITPDGVIAISSVPQVHDLPMLPQTWVDGLSRGSWQHESKIAALDLDELGGGGAWLLSLNRASEQPCRRVRVLAERLAASLAGSTSRHDAMTASVLDLVRKGEQGHPGVVAALRVLGDAFVVAVTADGSRSLTTARGEISRAIEGAVRLVAAQPRTVSLGDPCVVPSDPPFDPGESVGGHLSGAQASAAIPSRQSESEQASAIPPAEQVRPNPDVLARMRQLWIDREAHRQLDAIERPKVELPSLPSLATLLAGDDDPCVYRIDQLMPIGARVLFVAQMKTGKTTVTANLLRSLLDGESFLGYSVTPSSRHVVLIDTEMGSRMLRRWLGDIGIVHQERASVVTLRGRIHSFDLRDERIFAHWVDELRKLDTGVLVIDCLKPILDYLGLDENRETGQITTPLTRLMTEAGVGELILVHHMGHNGERSRGDSALRGWPEVEWHLLRLATDPEKEADMDAQRYFRAYGRDVDVPERRLDYDPISRRLSVGGISTRKADLANEKQAQLESSVLDLLNSEPGAKKGTIPARLRSRGQGRRASDVFVAVNALIARQAIDVRFEGRDDSTHLLYPKGWRA